MSSSRELEEAAARLKITLELSELGVGMTRERLRREHPHASKTELDALLARWLRERPGAEEGDGVGKPVTWPRAR